MLNRWTSSCWLMRFEIFLLKHLCVLLFKVKVNEFDAIQRFNHKRFYFEKTKMVSQTAIHKQLLFRTINVFLLWCRRFHSVYVSTGVCLCSSCGPVRVCGMHATCLPTVWLTSPQGHRQAASGMLLFCFCFLFVFVFVFSGMRSGCWSKCKNCLVRRDLSGGVMNRRWERNNLGLESTFRARLAAI